MDQVCHPYLLSVLIDTYVGYGGRYGLANAPQSVETPGPSAPHAGWSYARLQPTGTAPPTSAEESIQLDTYRAPSSSTPKLAENHVLFDDEDPFDDKELAA